MKSHVKKNTFSEIGGSYPTECHSTSRFITVTAVAKMSTTRCNEILTHHAQMVFVSNLIQTAEQSCRNTSAISLRCVPGVNRFSWGQAGEQQK